MSNHIPKRPKDSTLIYMRENWVIDPGRGSVYNKNTHKKIGHIAKAHGYCTINITGNISLKRSHVIWWAHYGEWPTQQIDHDDRDKANDSISNLKLATSASNAANRSTSIARELPVGVYKHEDCNRYEAKITVNNEVTNLGLFLTLAEATTARKKAEAELLTQDPKDCRVTGCPVDTVETVHSS